MVYFIGIVPKEKNKDNWESFSIKTKSFTEEDIAYGYFSSMVDQYEGSNYTVVIWTDDPKVSGDQST